MIHKAKCVLIGIVLLHGLFTGPLLVQCITADGRALTEFLGHDPCHLQSGAAQKGIDSGKAVDPCADLQIANPAVIQAAIDADARLAAGPVSSTVCLPREDVQRVSLLLWRSQPDILSPLPSGSRLEYSLRV